MVGYSGTPLSAKLGIKADAVVHLSGAPDGYLKLLEPLPGGVTFVSRPSKTTDLMQLFTVRRSDLAKTLRSCRTALKSDAILWIAWPKKASKVPTDITEETIRELALPLGSVDIKVCAVTEVWSGLKLVVRKELR